MKLTTTSLAAAGFLVLAGCDTPAPSLLSLDPVVTEQDTAVDAGLPGVWEMPGDKDTLCIIKQGDHGYKITFLGGGSPVEFQAQLFRTGPAEFLDVVPADDNDFRIPGHALARIWTGGGGLKWAFLDSDWLKQAASQLKTRTAGGKLLLLSPGATVRSFIATSGADDRAYGNVVTWQKAQ
jgi:hypothetical protein